MPDGRSSAFGIRAPKGPTRPGAPGRPPRPNTRSATLPEGPKIIKAMRNLRGQRTSGPGDPPLGFVTGTTSASEWKLLYWPLAEIFNDPPDPREPPYYGGRGGTWEYQSNQLGGRSGPGGAVVDAVVYTATGAIGLRLQTERFHTFASAKIQGNDARQKIDLMRAGYLTVIDLFEQDMIEDSTGETAIRIIRDALGLNQRPDPLYNGSARRSTAGRVL